MPKNDGKLREPANIVRRALDGNQTDQSFLDEPADRDRLCRAFVEAARYEMAFTILIQQCKTVHLVAGRY